MKFGWDGTRRRGFTIIEVMLFLAISGFLLVGILAGTGAGIARQRYTDSVQHVAQILREQYSAVINTQIPERDSGTGGACYSPSPDDLLNGGKITSDALNAYYDGDGNLREGNGGRGRTSCLVYGVAITIGLGTNDDKSGGNIIQTSSLVGKDIDALAKEDATIDLDAMTDIEILKKAGVNNLNVFYDVSGTGGVVKNWQCYVRTSESSLRYNLQWGARTETITKDDVLEATIIIFRSPKDGAVRTYVMDEVIKYQGKVLDYAEINGKNDGRGYGLQSENSGDCGGTIGSGGGYQLLKDAGINGYLDKFTQTDLNICVGSEDLFAFAGRRRMITLTRDGHSSGAVELIDAEDLTRNICEE
ncbi:MAG: type II secretion system protein [Candidatus Saccharimonadales bacterium]